VTELALALMLAVGAGLMLRSLQTLLSSDGGVRPETVATLELTLPQATYKSSISTRRFFTEVIERAHAVPGVVHVAVVNELPLRGKGSIAINVDSRERADLTTAEMVFAQLLYTTPDYFATLGIPLIRGRTFTTPYDSTRPPEIVINESLARRMWPNEEPLGKQLHNVDGTVVGVVGDVRAGSLESEKSPQLYQPLDRSPPANAAILARGTLEPRVLAMRLRDAVRAVDPSLATYNVRPMTEVISTAIAPRRTNTILITLFGLIALGLAAIGVYGVIAYGVARRTREIGIRLALGAGSRHVVRLVASEGAVLAVFGVGIGLVGAWALRQMLAGMLYGVTASDPFAFAGAAVILFVIAIAATLIPACAALRVDPVRAIKTE
jgi:putative ABC transport system permease protein